MQGKFLFFFLLVIGKLSAYSLLTLGGKLESMVEIYQIIVLFLSHYNVTSRALGTVSFKDLDLR